MRILIIGRNGLRRESGGDSASGSDSVRRIDTLPKQDIILVRD